MPTPAAAFRQSSGPGRRFLSLSEFQQDVVQSGIVDFFALKITHPDRIPSNPGQVNKGGRSITPSVGNPAESVGLQHSVDQIQYGSVISAFVGDITSNDDRVCQFRRRAPVENKRIGVWKAV